ncbi:Crp/Fnr family transcriptional regulator [uncultured Chryseobacterium sp.]|uniref:Crp/Fnr family transcriptional regulator n=1 Tax=uncultured Chryseobacterium sp. TaxID=259322 RepID=UPI0025ECC69D|nr:Crp/Fnr family transcriptional regulator [uncultured Chryseobacterium sp.]
MIINENYLRSAGAEMKEYSPGTIIFQEGNSPLYFYQIIEGQIKLNNFTEDGKEFIQNIKSEGQCFGEALLFLDKPYPMSATALSQCKVLRLCKENFFGMLDIYPKLYRDICLSMSDLLYYQYVMLQKNSSQNPSDRLIGVMSYLKYNQKKKEPFSFKIPLTRQQLANLTGICVETAIRTIKIMEKNNIVRIKDRKIFY